jgi:exonuclease SbcD
MEGAPVEEIRLAARAAFENLVTTAAFEGVACVVIAGDLYDGDRDDYNTALFLQRQFERLRDEGIDVVLAYGNHDAASEITKRLRPPKNVHVFPHGRPDTVVLEHVGLALHGQSYATNGVTQNLAAGYPQPLPNYLNVGVLHTALDGRPGHEPYAPCTAEQLAARGYGYWALGHVHAREVIRRDGTWIVFPGNLQGRHAKETGPKGATLVTYEGDEVVSADPQVLDTMRWLRCEVDISAAEDPDDVVAMASQSVIDETASDTDRLFAVRLELVGETDVAGLLMSQQESWEAQLRANVAGAEGRVWIEKIALKTSPPGRPGQEADAGEAIEAVRSAIAELRGSDAKRADLVSVLDPVRLKLGSDLPRLVELGAPEMSDAGVLTLLDEVEALLMSELRGEAQ